MSSLSQPSRRLLRKAAATASSSKTKPTTTITATTTPAASSASLHTTAARPAWWNPFSKNNKPSPKRSGTFDPLRDDPLAREAESSAETRSSLVGRLGRTRVEGSSIFEDEIKRTEGTGHSGEPPSSTAVLSPGVGGSGGAGAGPRSFYGASLLPEPSSRHTDPDPRSRAAWLRRQVTRRVATAGTDPFSREPRALVLRRTEREAAHRSAFLPTSVKKLGPLARQIAGKTVGDALLQMRFSRKKMAREVGFVLGEARDRAVVERGMGLGEARGEVLPEGMEITLRTKDGRFVTVDDPTRMYIDQAWVGRGPWRAIKTMYRARGRAERQYRPSTSITVVLKEEKTRIRQHLERQEKEYKQGPWVHLPNRPVTAQRPYYSW